MTLFDAEHVQTSDAVISGCGRYRYRLTRTWDTVLRPACFIMLNPSTADATQDDPTIRRCIGFAKSWACGGIVVVNLFAFRATEPKNMKTAADPIGPENDAHILNAIKECCPIIAAWGRQGTFRNRNRQVSTMLVKAGVTVHCLRRSIDGEPWHPLYVPGNVQLDVMLDPSIVREAGGR